MLPFSASATAAACDLRDVAVRASRTALPRAVWPLTLVAARRSAFEANSTTKLSALPLARSSVSPFWMGAEASGAPTPPAADAAARTWPAWAAMRTNAAIAARRRRGIARTLQTDETVDPLRPWTLLGDRATTTNGRTLALYSGKDAAASRNREPRDAVVVRPRTESSI